VPWLLLQVWDASGATCLTPFRSWCWPVWRYAFERVLKASQHIGVRGIVVHAASTAAREFYLHMGFESSPSDPNMLLLRLVDVAAASII
jgi:hypothetical protein